MVKRKHTFRKTVFREIKGSLGRYLAILFIVALGAGFFTGLKTCKPSMLETAEKYTTEQNLFDYRLLSTLGFTQEDVDAFSLLDGVNNACGSYFSDVLCESSDGTEIVLKAHSITDGVNIPRLEAGRLPESPDECLLDGFYFGEKMLGTVLHISDSNSSETKELLPCRDYTVVGLCMSPYYINFERGTTALGTGQVAGYVYIPEEGFSSEVYMEIFLDVDAPGYIYSDEYNDSIESYRDRLTSVTEERSILRYESIISDAQETLDDARSEYEDGRSRYYQEKYDAEKALDEALSDLYAAEDEIERSEETLRSSEYTLNSNRAKVQSGYEQLDEAEAELDTQQTAAYESFDAQLAELEAALAQVDASLEQISGLGLTEQESQLTAQREQILAGLRQLSEARAEAEAQFTEARAQLDSQRAELDYSSALISNGIHEISRGREELENARAELDQGWLDYTKAKDDAQEEFAKAEQELSDAKKEIDDAQEELDSLETPVTFVLDRGSNVGYVCFESDSGIVEGISTVFPLFFFLVAALVCITTMTRMVDEQRTQIGVLKALGYSSRKIMSKYLIYSGSASLIGSVLGISVGSVVFPKVIWMAYSIMYGFSDLVLAFRPVTAIASTGFFLLGAVGATWLSCRSELIVSAADLIRPKAPKSGKRIFLERIEWLWGRLKFLQKVSIRNIFRYKKRMFMMMLGIGGCTALLLTGFGISDSIKHLADHQYDEISIYDGSVTFSSPIKNSEQDKFTADHSDIIESALFLHEGTVDAIANGRTKSTNLVVSDTDVSGFIDLHSGSEHIEWPGLNEAVINNKLAQSLDLNVGDTITLRDDDMNAYTLIISGIFDNYVYNYVYISSETASAQTGSVPEFRSAYLLLDENVDAHEAAAEISGSNNVSSVSLTVDIRERIIKMMSSLDYIVLLITFCAGALAFIVLYNLTNINITERLREIATIKVLGFYPWESASYVFRENLVLTAFGAVIGLIGGVGLHRFVMLQIKIDLMYFHPRIEPISYIYSLILTLIFAVIVDVFMFFKLKKINMAEALKSIE